MFHIDDKPDCIDDLYEVIDGRFVQKPTCTLGQITVGQLQTAMRSSLPKAQSHKLIPYLLFECEAGRLYLRPSFAFVVFPRWPLSKEEMNAEFITYRPALVCEALAPTMTEHEVAVRRDRWFDFGVEEVWLLDSIRRKMILYRSRDCVELLGEEDILTCPRLIPELTCSLSDVFVNVESD
jgi:Uma2 family endonuclease